MTNQNLELDPVNFISVHAFVFAETILFLVLLKLYPPKYSEFFSIDFIMQTFEDLSDFVVLFIIFLALFTVGFMAIRFGRFYYFQLIDDVIAEQPSYLVLSLTREIEALLSVIFIIIAAKLIAKNQKKTCFNWLFLVAWGGLLFFYGRRNLFYPFFFSLIWYLRKKNINLFKRNAIFPLIAGIFFTFVLSNLFQTVRVYLADKAWDKSEIENQIQIRDALDFNITIENVQTRTPYYLVDSWILEKMNGSVVGLAEFAEATIEQIKIAIPRFLWPEKQFTMIDDLISRYIEKPATDLPDTVNNLFLLDFGYFAIILVPLFLYACWAGFSNLLFRLFSSPCFFVLGFSLFFHRAFHVEGGGVGSWLVGFRECLILLGVSKVFAIFSQSFRKAILKTT